MEEPFVRKAPQYLELSSWNKLQPDLIAGMSLKDGGASTGFYQSLNMGFHVGEDPVVTSANRRILGEKLGFPAENWTGAEQTHETKIVKITGAHKGMGALEYDTALHAVDGMYTDESGVLLTLCFADCVPLLFYAPDYHRVGAAHAGWKGTVGGIGAKMVKKWEEEGIPPESIYAAVGPSICRECYTVDDKVIAPLQKLLEEVDEKPYNLISEGQYQLDLKRANALILEQAGIPKSRIEVSALCTSCREDLFYSHRRDAGKTGRMISFIGWKKEHEV